MYKCSLVKENMTQIICDCDVCGNRSGYHPSLHIKVRGEERFFHACSKKCLNTIYDNPKLIAKKLNKNRPKIKRPKSRFMMSQNKLLAKMMNRAFAPKKIG